MMMRGRRGKGPPSTDLLVCFPTRAHLSLMPKPICSPARPRPPDSSHHYHRRRHSHHHLRTTTTNHGSPLMWAQTKHNNSNNKNSAEMSSEPTSPKVTCAGQIKVRTKPNSCKSWQSVMEEIERMHSKSKKKKRTPWMEALGFKKEVMQFLHCLRKISFDFRCFGAIPSVEITSDDDDDDKEEEDDDEFVRGNDDYRNYRRKSSSGERDSSAVFSKWFMILQEENDLSKDKVIIRPSFDDTAAEEAPPPPNALLLMRCRSAPAKSWLEEREEEEERERRESEEEKERGSKGTDFCEFAVEIAKENWIQEKISRSRSWKR